MFFLSYSDSLSRNEGIAVDCYHSGCTNLSHWRGVMKSNQWADDTSTGIVLNFLLAGQDPNTYEFTTANHFDIDGFLGVWALHHPEKALTHEKALREAALIGDFRELAIAKPETDLALKLVCWINTVERQRFYAPFDNSEDTEAQQCVNKFLFFLDTFEAVLDEPDKYKADWQDEYDRVYQDVEKLTHEDTVVTELKPLRMRIVETPDPLHYYALFANSAASDIVLSIYNGNRYELEYKFTTWVDTPLRNSFPRINIHKLAATLSKMERSGYRWTFNNITDSGPILRLDETRLDKATRFHHPYARSIYASSIAREQFKESIIEFFTLAYSQISPKGLWSWEEVHQINMGLMVGSPRPELVKK